MEHSGHRRRMRERYRAHGLDGFAPHEALELMLFYAIPQRNVNPLAHRLLERYGSLPAVLNASPESLEQVEGVGEYAATLLSLFGAASRRLQRDLGGPREVIRSRADAEAHCVRLLAGERRECFYVVCMNGQMESLGDVLIATGSIADVPAYPRVIADAVLARNAHCVLLCHNHPGGSLLPSQKDVESTAVIGGLLETLEVVLCDHIIVADGQALSMVREQYIQQEITPGGVQTRVADSSGEVLPKRCRRKTEEA